VPDRARAPVALDSFDLVEGLVLKDGPPVEVLNGVSWHGGLVASWPVPAPVTTDGTLAALPEHGRLVGRPAYAPFANDPLFQGTHRWPAARGRLIRWCLGLGGAGVGAACGEGLAGPERELPRLVAEPARVAVSAPRPDRLAAAVAASRAGVAAAPGGPDRGGAVPAALPGGRALPTTPAAGGPAGLPQAAQGAEPGERARSDRVAERGVAAPARPRRSRSRPGQGSLLRAAAP